MSDELLSPDAPVKQVTISLNGKERTVCIPRNASADDFKTSIIDQLASRLFALLYRQVPSP